MPDRRDVDQFLDAMEDVVSDWHSSRDSMRWRPDGPGKPSVSSYRGMSFDDISSEMANNLLRAASSSMGEVLQGFERLSAALAADPSLVALAVLSNWHNARRGWRDVLRCLVGQHHGVTVAEVRGALYARCSCGAICRDGGPWIDGKPFTRRKGWR